MFCLGSVSPDLEESRGCRQDLLTTKEAFRFKSELKNLCITEFFLSDGNNEI
tara:strand:- start:105 stop:260 length:156 start_codon:yes stop_codon:yes gene_type:complete